MTEPTTYYPDSALPSFPFAGSIAVAINDTVLQDSSGNAIPASSLADQGGKAANQLYAAQYFAGVAREARTATQTRTTLIVDPTFIGPKTCESGTWKIGDLVAIATSAAGTALLNGKVEKVTDPKLAVGVCWRTESAAVTTVIVKMLSAILPPRNQAPFAATGTNLSLSGALAVAGKTALGTATLAAAGGNQATAAAIATSTVVVTGADASKGAKLPTTVTANPVLVLNSGNAALKLYPNSTETINGGNASVAVDVAAGNLAIAFNDGTNWTTKQVS